MAPDARSTSGTNSAIFRLVSRRADLGGVSVVTNRDRSVTIRLVVDGRLVVEATDRGVGGPPILRAGRIGVRGDNAEFDLGGVVVRPARSSP